MPCPSTLPSPSCRSPSRSSRSRTPAASPTTAPATRSPTASPRRGHRLADRAIVPDEVEAIRGKVKAWIADPGIDVVITTGGTGFTGRDVTPEAIEPLFEKRMDGFSAIFHRICYDKIGTSTLQSRATGGVAGATYIFVLPGLSRRLPGRLGRHPSDAARLPPPAVQLRRDHAAPRRASEARQEPALKLSRRPGRARSPRQCAPGAPQPRPSGRCDGRDRRRALGAAR